MSLPQNMSPVIRRMSSADVPALVQIHQTSWAPYELSVKLGSEYLTHFYSMVVKAPDAFGFVAESAGAIAGYAVGFSDYYGFNKRFARELRFSLARILVRRILGGRINFADVLNLFGESRKGKRARFMRWHLGSLALDNSFKGTTVGKEAITSAMIAVLSQLRRLSAPGCSAVCDARNIPMRKRFIGIGFEECEEIPMAGRSLILLEQAFQR